jgi:hypothetical protein
LIGAASLADPRTRIEAALGELAAFEIITGDEQPKKPVLVWSKAGSNLAARLSFQAESSAVRSRPGAVKLRRIHETAAWGASHVHEPKRSDLIGRACVLPD